MSNSYYIGNVKIPQDTLNKINALMASNQKLEAIKYVREISGFGLADAKKWVENYQSYDLTEKQPFDSQIHTQASSSSNDTESDNIEKRSEKKNTTNQKEKKPTKAEKLNTFDILFPTTYGNTRFMSIKMDAYSCFIFLWI